jgi:hypothetical protein
MNTYCSFLVVNPGHSEVVGSLCPPDNNWSLQLRPDPSGRFWFSQSGSIRSITHPSALGDQMPSEEPGQLILVDADESVANNVIQLICASYDVLEGNPSERIGLRSAFEIPTDSSEQKSIFRYVFQTKGYFERFVHQPNLPVALHIAAKAWSDKSTIYAIHKLARSFDTESISWWSTDPRHGQVFDKTSEIYSDHVNTAVAINLAFSAIEELQLQVKSSSGNKRFLELSSGEWNPKVLDDIKSRLQNAGIDPGQKITWFLRGDKSISETSITPKLGAPAFNNQNPVVRDVELTIPEALHYCSYIRNFMTAHKFNQTSSTSLGPYDLHNVQSVARRLILSKCGMWNVWIDDLLRG